MSRWRSECKAIIRMKHTIPKFVSYMDEAISRVFLSRSLNHSCTSLTMWIYDLKSNMGRHNLITSQWCELLTDMREPPLMLMSLKVLHYSLQGMNRLFDVEHKTKYFSQRYGSDKLVNDVASSKVLERCFEVNFLDEAVMSTRRNFIVKWE